MSRIPRYEPMLASAWPAPFSDPDWLFEIKWDGVRLILSWDGAGTTLRTRRGRDATVTYPELSGFAAPHPCVLDGEIVAPDERGVPSFEKLQQRMNVADAARAVELAHAAPLTFVVFDLLYAGEDVTPLSLVERRARLSQLGLPPPCVVSDVVPAVGGDLFDFVRVRDLEGMVAKRAASRYVSGVRSPDWRKVAHRKLVNAVVGGFTVGDRSRAATFGSLLVGLHTAGGLQWVGAVGSGFDERSLRAIRDALDQQTIDRCPFIEEPDVPAPTVWVGPRLVAVVEFKEWTSAGRLRAPVFKGFSEVHPDEATWESEGPELERGHT